MKSKFILLPLLLTLTAPVAFATSNTTTPMPNATATTSTATDENAQQNGETINMLIVLDNNEVNAAKVAMKKATNPAVKKFAADMDKDHSKNLKTTMKLSKTLKQAPVPSDASNSLKQNGDEQVNKLSALDSKDFDAAYMDNMVNDHKAALQMLDDKISSTTNPQLKKHLEATKTHVNAHLEKAQQIQSKLANNA